ncbi:MAG TPA: sulfurtransferase, partial [Moraxellaceae bacterium]
MSVPNLSLRKLAALAALSLVAWLPAGASASSFLVSTDWLEKNLNNPKVRIVEVSVNPGLYERGHIPGAVNFSWHTDLVDPVKRDIASPQNFEKLLQTAGISKDTTVVLYGDNNNWFAAWAAWVFDIYQVDNVKLLDGGRKKWEAENRSQSPVAPAYAAGSIKIGKTDNKLRARLPDVVSAAEKRSNVTLVDIRSPDEYSGKIFAPAGVQELAVRAGHVPGAINVPWGKAVAEDGTFKPAAELKKI